MSDSAETMLLKWTPPDYVRVEVGMRMKLNVEPGWWEIVEIVSPGQFMLRRISDGTERVH